METYQLDDIKITAFCLSKGVKLLGIIQDTHRHFIFRLSDPKKCEQLKTRYLNGASAPAAELFSHRERLINEIKAKNRQKEGEIRE